MSKTAILFAGQGAQSVGMGRDLATEFPSARRLFEEANEALGYDLAKICFEGPEPELTQTEHAQPGIYLVGWVSWVLLREQVPGLQVEATAGLSLGEFTALAAAEAFGFEEGLRLVRRRGQLMQDACDASQGGMAAVIGLDETATRKVCEEAGVEIANLNCPGQIVISGGLNNIRAACEIARTAGAKKAMLLPVAGAYHSNLMEPARRSFDETLSQVRLVEPNVTVISNVTGRPHGSEGEIRSRLLDQVVASVRWEAGIRYLLDAGFTRFIELGPGKALSGFMKRIDRSAEVLQVGDTGSLAVAVETLKATLS